MRGALFYWYKAGGAATAYLRFAVFLRGGFLPAAFFPTGFFPRALFFAAFFFVTFLALTPTMLSPGLACPRRSPFILRSGVLMTILVPGGTLLVSQTLPPMIEPRPITVSPPRMVAPA